MNILWNRVFAVLFGLVGLILFLRYRSSIGQFVSNIEKIGPEHAQLDQNYGILAIAMIGFLIVVVVKLLTHRQ